MTSDKKLEEIKEKSKETANKLFGKKPKEVEEELERESTLGSPDNLITPDNKEE